MKSSKKWIVRKKEQMWNKRKIVKDGLEVHREEECCGQLDKFA
jgi:hypothetical protein